MADSTFLGTWPLLNMVMAPPPALGFMSSMPSAVRKTKKMKKAHRKPKLRQRCERLYEKASCMYRDPSTVVCPGSLP